METNDQYFDCLCRTCMNELVEATPYDGNTKPQQQWQSIFDRIEECGAFRISELLTNAVPQIEVQPRDELPKRICCKCFQELLIVYRFQQMCIQSEQQMRQQVSKKRSDLDISIEGAAMDGEIESNNADSKQESLLEITEHVVKPEAAETVNDDIDQLLEDCRDAEGNLSEFVKNEPIEDDESSMEYSDGGTQHSIISVKGEGLSVEIVEQQINEPNEDNGPGVEYSDGETTSATSEKDERLSIEFEEQQINETNVKKHHSRHVDQHKARHKVACDICGKAIVKRNLKTHKLTHSNEKAHKCDVCGKRFKRITYLRSHIRTHTGEKPYKCKYCECSFHDRSNQISHMRVHFGDNIYRCELCPLAFPAAINLRAHSTEHKNEDSETRERNMKALQEAEVKLQLELSKKYKPVQKANKCEFCGKCFARIGDLYRHMRKHTGEKPFKCKYCERSFVDPSHRIRHMRIHLGDNIYRCVLCPLAFRLAKELSAHLTEHSNDDSETRERNMKALKEAEAMLQLKLSETETPQPSKENVRTYRFMHGEDNPFGCPYCPRRFNDYRNMYLHKEIHKGAKRVACDICGKSVLKRSLKTHKLIHSKEKAHKCDICEMGFGRIESLRRHMRKHTGEKPYKCKYCERSFKDPSDRIKHMSIHVGDNIYRCELCPLAFRLAKELRTHLTEHDNDDSETRERNMKALKEAEAKLQLKLSETETQQPLKEVSKQQLEIKAKENLKPHKYYESLYCPLKYSSRSALSIHKQTHEGVRRRACDICGKMISGKNFNKHKLLHSNEKAHKCDFCKTSFAQISYLRSHIRTHTGEKPFKCKYCECTFAHQDNRKKHMRIHLGDNVHRCRFCPLAFPSAAEMRLHFTAHKNEDPQTRERNMKALKEVEAELQLKSSKNETHQPPKKVSQQQ